MGQSDDLRSPVFERKSARVISATFVEAFLVVWSVYLSFYPERNAQRSFKKIEIHRSYVGTSLRRGTFLPLGSHGKPTPMVLRWSLGVDIF